MKKKPVKNKSQDLKIIIVGDSGTGKTSFVNRYILNKFTGNYQATIATQFSSKIIKFNDTTYRLQFWDIAGQDRNVTTTNIFCKNTNGIVLCCEIIDISTLNNTLIWKNSIEQNIDIKNVPMIIVQNKCDLLGEDLNYNNGIDDELKEFGKQNGIKNCFRTSALNGFGIQESMEYLINEIIKLSDLGEINDNNGDNRETIAIDDKPRIIRGKSNGCC